MLHCRLHQYCFLAVLSLVPPSTNRAPTVADTYACTSHACMQDAPPSLPPRSTFTTARYIRLTFYCAAVMICHLCVNFKAMSPSKNAGVYMLRIMLIMIICASLSRVIIYFVLFAYMCVCVELRISLFLNVWTPPGARKGSNLPVMVWLFGGGFQQGASSHPEYDGKRLAEKGARPPSITHTPIHCYEYSLCRVDSATKKKMPCLTFYSYTSLFFLSFDFLFFILGISLPFGFKNASPVVL